MWAKLRICASAAMFALAGIFAGTAAAQPVVPNSNASVEGPGETNEPFHNTALTIQYYIHRSQVNLPGGSLIGGMSWRMNGSAATYPTTMNFSQYDIQFSQSDANSYNLGSLNSNTFATNMAGTVTTVRSGALTVAGNSLPGGAGGSPNTNPFGYYITFSTPYAYVAGTDIVITIRHSAGPAVAPQLDSINGSFGVCWCKYGSGAAATTAIIPNAGFCILRLQGAAAPAPEIDINRSGQGITADGGSDNVGSGYTAGSAFGLNYLVNNTGNATLSVSQPVLGSQSNCSVFVSVAPASQAPAGSGTWFGISVTPGGSGSFSFTVSVGNNDSNENPYNFTVSGSAGSAAAPEVGVSRAPFAVTDGGTDFAYGASAGVTQYLSYVISNTGSATLTVGMPGVSSQVNCTAYVSASPASSVGASSQTTFVVALTPSASGAFSFVVSFTNNDANENPFNWTVSGTAGAPTTAPEMDVYDNLYGLLTLVADGGNLAIGDQVVGADLNIEFYITNYMGSATLTLAAPTVVSQVNCDVVIIQMPAASAAAGDDTDFVVRVTPVAPGAFSFGLSVANNDADENPYEFTVSGNGVTGGGGNGGGGSDDAPAAGCSAADGASGGLLVAALVALAATAGVRRKRA